MGAQPEVVWKPLEGMQALAISSPCHFTLLDGTRGPGKTDAQIMFFRRYVGLGYGAFWKGVIFDREYKNLDDIVSKSEKWFPKFRDGARFLRSASEYKWVWPTGEQLLFRQIKKPSDYNNYHGHEYPYIGWNELTKYANRDLLDAMDSTNRSSFIPEEHTPKNEDGSYRTPDGKPLPEIPLRTFATTNPHGIGHNWVKRDFIDVAPPGKIHRITTNVYNPRTKQREDVVKTQVRLFGSYKENKYLSPDYVAKLENITDPNKRKAWLFGDWNIISGGAIDDLWNESVHVIPRTPIPKEWRTFCSMDWGSTAPFSIGWWAVTNGEEIKLSNGKMFCPAPGSLIRFAEWYGSDNIGTNKGIKMSSRLVARGKNERDAMLVKMGWTYAKPSPGPGDNSIGKIDDVGVDNILKEMRKEKVIWTPSDRSPGSRTIGLDLLRNRLEAANLGEGRAIYVMDNCRAFIATVPILPRDEDKPDDVDTEAEDHIYDDTRYAILSQGAEKPPMIEAPSF